MEPAEAAFLDGSDSTYFPVNIEPAETSFCIGKSWPVTDESQTAPGFHYNSLCL